MGVTAPPEPLQSAEVVAWCWGSAFGIRSWGAQVMGLGFWVLCLWFMGLGLGLCEAPRLWPGVGVQRLGFGVGGLMSRVWG